MAPSVFGYNSTLLGLLLVSLIRLLALGQVGTHLMVEQLPRAVHPHAAQHQSPSLFNKRFAWLNAYIPWVLGPLFGQSPETYFAHHVGMHHLENNLTGDLSSTMRYQRDSFTDFLRYLLRFFAIGVFELASYFAYRRRHSLLKRTILGELVFFAATAVLLAANWRAALVVFVVPVVITRFAMMAGNWAQHAFIDASAPENHYRNSITCINCTYNRRCFNDGYHIGHHRQRTRHWTELPGELVANRGVYASEEPSSSTAWTSSRSGSS